MKKMLLAGVVLLGLVGAAHAAEDYPNGTEVLSCSGHLAAAMQGYFAIQRCEVPKGQETYDFDMSDIAPSDRSWIIKVCGEVQKGAGGPSCGVQAMVVESSTHDDTFKVLKVLHVTNGS